MTEERREDRHRRLRPRRRLAADALGQRRATRSSILDLSTRAFERLPSSFGGTAVRGDGTDEDVLRRAGAEGADVFVALTEGDNRNVMSAQLAVEAFEIPTSIAKINDPVAPAAYSELGIATICRTEPDGRCAQCLPRAATVGLAGMLAPTGTPPGRRAPRRGGRRAPGHDTTADAERARRRPHHRSRRAGRSEEA